MAYDEEFALRVGSAFDRAGSRYVVKKMMGGLCYMVDDKMCVGVMLDDLMARLDPELNEEFLEEPGCRPMDFTGRPMKGFVYVEIDALKTDDRLDLWIQRALEFNPRAKRSKPKKKKEQ